jgi:hypothetical protein
VSRPPRRRIVGRQHHRLDPGARRLRKVPWHQRGGVSRRREVPVGLDDFHEPRRAEAPTQPKGGLDSPVGRRHDALLRPKAETLDG